MIGRLRCSIVPLPHPHPNAPGASNEQWSLISFVIEHGEARQTLLETQWDAGAFAAWFVENRDRLCHDTWTRSDPAWSLRPGESLASALERHQRREFADDPSTRDAEDQWLDALYAFRESHSLRFALRGANIPSVLIGCNQGSGEISSTSPSQWRHEFEMTDFLRSLAGELYRALEATPALVGSASSTREQLRAIITAFDSPTSQACCRS